MERGIMGTLRLSIAGAGRLKQEIDQVDRKASPIRRGICLAFFALPVLYVSLILSTAVHEILGHGLCAMLLGGEFSGFVLKWDGMGWAYSDLPATASLSHHILYLASGIAANLTCGAVLLGTALLLRTRPSAQLALFIISFTCLIDGSSYILWDAYHPVPLGDIGRILWLWAGPQFAHVSTIRWVLLVVGGLLFVGTTFCCCALAFTRAETLILGGDQFTGRSRFLALVLLLVLPGSVAWFTFDWNQLTPGIGRLPSVTGALSMGVAAALLFWYRPGWWLKDRVRSITFPHIAVAWVCLITTILMLVLWAQDGIIWG